MAFWPLTSSFSDEQDYALKKFVNIENNFFQGSHADLNGYELQSNKGSEAPDSLLKNSVTAQASNASGTTPKAEEEAKLASLGMISN